MKLEQMKQLSNYELLDLQKKCIQVGTANIKDELNLDFSYTSLINELKVRGAVQEYHFPDEKDQENPGKAREISLKRAKELTTRKSMSIENSVLERWEEFTADYPQNHVFATEALKMFLDAYDRGEIKLTLK